MYVGRAWLVSYTVADRQSVSDLDFSVDSSYSSKNRYNEIMSVVSV
jgi:hypothetical protein